MIASCSRRGVIFAQLQTVLILETLEEVSMGEPPRRPGPDAALLLLLVAVVLGQMVMRKKRRRRRYPDYKDWTCPMKRHP